MAGAELVGSSVDNNKREPRQSQEAVSSEECPAFRRLELIEAAIHWWYGDLALSYEGQYGAIAEIAEQLGFDYNTIANDKWVASRYEVSLRSETLSFHHHQIAAPLDDRQLFSSALFSHSIVRKKR